MTDLQIEVLKRGKYLPSDYSLSPDYGGPKTAQEALDEFFRDLPSNLTFGLIPKANPYGRLTPDQRRSYDAGRAADVTQAIEKQREAQLKSLQEGIDKKTEQQRQQNEEDEATDTARYIDLLEQIERMRGKSALEQIERAGDVGTRQSIAQMQALYPYLRQAGIEGREGALSVSQRYKAFKEMLPSSIQAIMESKQRQQQLASDAFAREAQAIATQQSAATGFGTQGIGRYSGRRIA